MNIYDISKQAGVSIATVSRVLNGSEKVSPATRQKVLDVMKENGYTPNAFARSLGLNTMSTVGLLCADSSDVYLAQAVYFLERELRNHSYTSMLCCTGYDLQEKKEYVKLLLSRNVDALFFIGSNFVEDSLKGNDYIIDAAKKIPVFILNGELTEKNIYSVLCDDRNATKDMTDLVFSKGASHPIYLYRALSYSGKKKLQGFCDSLKEHGVVDAERFAFSSPGPLHKTREILETLRKNGIFFDAVVTADDELATGAVKYALQNGYYIPEDFQITGYNNSVLSTCSTPEITTLDNRVEFMCVTAVSQMLQVLQGKDIPPRIMFPGNIIERRTTRS